MDTYTFSESVHVEMRIGARTVTRHWPAGLRAEGEDDRRALDLLLRTGHAKRGRRRKAGALGARRLPREVDEQ